MKLQLGGNKEWKGWANLDATGAIPFHFKVGNKLPFNDLSHEIIYTSHMLEHIPQDVVDYVLNECHRILKNYCFLIIKIPDFDSILANWKAGNNDYFKKLGVRKVVSSWKTYNIPDTIDYRCSFLFCGFWNEKWGDHFAGIRRNIPGAYHGPVPMDQESLKELLSNGNPHFISSKLREKAPEEAIFNHQNAWGKKEFEGLLRRHNFYVTSQTKEEIIEEYSHIPDIANMKNISLYMSCYKI